MSTFWHNHLGESPKATIQRTPLTSNPIVLEILKSGLHRTALDAIQGEPVVCGVHHITAHLVWPFPSVEMLPMVIIQP